MNRQIQARQAGERSARLELLRLLCAVSVWRTAMTRLLPLGGVSTWWVMLLCLLPGLSVAGMLRLIMACTRSSTLTEAIRACLGQGGAILLSVALSLPLLLDGLTSITALITLFTEGVGTRGTQLTLAALTGAALLLSLHREGLARAAWFLRWGMATAALILAALLLTDAHTDHLFPLRGEGNASVFAAIRAGFSLAWPVALLLTVEPIAGKGRLYGACTPLFSSTAAVLVTTLVIPHELLTRLTGLAGALLLPIQYASNAMRVLTLSLLMLTFFLAIGASAQAGASTLMSCAKEAPGWLPGALVAGMFLTQAADASVLWSLLGIVEPWLLLPLAVLTTVCIPIALYRRKCP